MIEHLLQLFGVSTLGLSGILLFYIGAGHWYCRYGREALLCASVYFVTAAGMVLLSIGGVLSLEHSRTINLLLSTCFLFIMLQVAWVHRKQHHIENGGVM